MDYRHEWKHVISYTDMLVSKEIKVYTNDYGATVVHVERGGLWVNYEFSEM